MNIDSLCDYCLNRCSVALFMIIVFLQLLVGWVTSFLIIEMFHSVLLMMMMMMIMIMMLLLLLLMMMIMMMMMMITILCSS